MTWTWHAAEQDARLRHAEALRRAALDRLVGEARRAGRARRGPGRARRLLHRLGGWLVAWGGRLQAPGAGQAPKPTSPGSPCGAGSARRLPRRLTKQSGDGGGQGDHPGHHLAQAQRGPAAARQHLAPRCSRTTRGSLLCVSVASQSELNTTNRMNKVSTARLSIGFTSTFVLILAILHFLEPGFNSDGHLISEYELGRYGWLMSLAFISMAGASLALWFALRDDLHTTAGRLGEWWLLLIALAYLGAGLFYPDDSTGLGLPEYPAHVERGALAPTLNATLHGLSGVLVIASSPIVFTLLSRSLAETPRWASRARALRWPTWLAWIGLVSFPTSLVLYSAVQQPGVLDLRVVVSASNRFMILTYAAWLATCAYQITKLDVGRAGVTTSLPTGSPLRRLMWIHRSGKCRAAAAYGPGSSRRAGEQAPEGLGPVARQAQGLGQLADGRLDAVAQRAPRGGGRPAGASGARPGRGW